MWTEHQAVTKLDGLRLTDDQRAWAVQMIQQAVNRLDLDLFITYLRLWKYAQDAADEVDRLGPIIETESGTVKKNPALAVVKELATLLARLHKRLDIAGLSLEAP